jgi:glycerol-3-phosphate dehydrogenase
LWQSGWRDRAWSALDNPWDIIVIGGGITGSGILREATHAGLRALLLEAHDFAAGTSSRSSKLVHGGFRYLRNAQIKLTYQAVHERERLLKEGRGLVNPLGCLLANYQEDSIPGWIFGAGLVFYDMLALKWGHRRYDGYDMQTLCPALCDEGLRGGYRFFDAQTDDARLVLRIIQESVQDGALALNYAPVTYLLRTGQYRNKKWPLASQSSSNGSVCGVVVCDSGIKGGGRTKEVFAPVVINATGVWADDLRGLVGGKPRLRRLRGSHLIFPTQRLPLTRSVNVLHPKDGRPVFAYVWEGVTIVGTTDVDHKLPLQIDPAISQTEVEYLLSFVQRAFPGQDLRENDIQGTLSGIRSVVDTGKADPSKESREHVIWTEDGLLTITGGKLTTFRLMALAALQAVRERLPDRVDIDKRHRILNPVQVETISTDSLSPAMRMRLLGRYGNSVSALLEAARPTELDSIGGGLPIWAELRWAARSEGVNHLDDLLLRRVRLGLLRPQGGLNHMERIRSIAQTELGWDDSTWEKEQARYTDTWHRAYDFSR